MVGRLANFFLDLKDENGSVYPVIFRCITKPQETGFGGVANNLLPKNITAVDNDMRLFTKTKQVHHLLLCLFFNVQ